MHFQVLLILVCNSSFINSEFNPWHKYFYYSLYTSVDKSSSSYSVSVCPTHYKRCNGMGVLDVLSWIQLWTVWKASPLERRGPEYIGVALNNYGSFTIAEDPDRNYCSVLHIPVISLCYSTLRRIQLATVCQEWNFTLSKPSSAPYSRDPCYAHVSPTFTAIHCV